MSNLKISYVFFLIVFCFFTSCSAKKNNPCHDELLTVNQLIKTNNNQTICFDTIDSYDLDFEDKKSLEIFGHLTFPDIKKDKYSVIILTHGAGGIRRYHSNYIDLLNKNGYAVFQIDHYTPRNIRYDKTFTKISGITFMIDAYKALEILKTHPMINKVGYVGWSQGGVGPILSHFPHVTKFINSNKYIFDAAISIYPYCGFTFPDKMPTNTPLLMITGDEDMLTPEQACRNLYSKFFKGDGKIKHISIENAHHGYDNPFLYFGFTLDNLPSLVVTNNDCTLTISKTGRIITLTNKDVSVPGASSELLDRCSIRGVKVKYNSEARKKTEEVLLNFLTKNQFN
tara:strand:+ start:95 stop:1117 length:1023 start_codon:yes stop_codon:yes gene_type:complete